MAWRQGNKEYKNLDPQKKIIKFMMIPNFCLMVTLKWRELSYNVSVTQMAVIKA